MFRPIAGVFFSLLVFIGSFAQKPGSPVHAPSDRPKLVVGIVVDQMRWDYLYRYYNRFGTGGFRRLLGEGFSCENTLINYLPSYTAVGHTCIFTGSVPSLTGIAGNDWREQLTGQHVYCTDDSTVRGVGANGTGGKMSPRNLLVTTVTDELRMATNFQSRTVGISLKDRAAILPAGHAATAAYWLDDGSANFISSTYYMQQLPAWAEKFNAEKHIEKLVAGDWNTLYPIAGYAESDPDDQPYEGKFAGETASVFPHAIGTAYAASHGALRYSPFGNTLTLQFAKTALDGYSLGRGPATDFLTINCASTDYVGHMFGPNSIEVEDTYLRLDKDLADFFNALDARVGKGNWLLFLTADHGAAHAVGFSQAHNLPGDFFEANRIVDELNAHLDSLFHVSRLVATGENYQISFDLAKVAANRLSLDSLEDAAVDWLRRLPGVTYAVAPDRIGQSAIPEPIKTMIANGYNFKRSGQVEVIFNAGWLDTESRTGTTHGAWNPYDTHIPLVFLGWHVTHGSSSRTVHMTDIAPTVAAMLHIQMPSGCIGTPITEVSR